MSLPPTFVDGFSDEASLRQIPYNRLGQTDLIVSRLAFGCASISHGVKFADGKLVQNLEENPNLVAAFDLIEAAAKSGINYFDTSPFYGAGKSEVVLGECLSRLPRSSFYVATKVGRNEVAEFNYSAEEVTRVVTNSLKNLKVDCIDVVQVHDVEFADHKTIITETLPTLDRLRSAGKIRYIGVTGYPLEPLKKVIQESPVKINLVLSYCRDTLFNHDLKDFLPFFRESKLGIINAAVHGMGLLTGDILPDWHAASLSIRNSCLQAKSICQKSGVSLPRLVMGSAFANNDVDTILTGMKSVSILHDNLDVLKNGLTGKEVEVLAVIDRDVMSPLKSAGISGSWEGVEIEQYRANPRDFCDNLRRLHGSP